MNFMSSVDREGDGDLGVDSLHLVAVAGWLGRLFFVLFSSEAEYSLNSPCERLVGGCMDGGRDIGLHC